MSFETVTADEFTQLLGMYEKLQKTGRQLQGTQFYYTGTDLLHVFDLNCKFADMDRYTDRKYQLKVNFRV